MTKFTTTEIELSDLMLACAVLDIVIKQRAAEENKFLDKLAGRSLTDTQAKLVSIGLISLDELENLRNRLFNKIPLEML